MTWIDLDPRKFGSIEEYCLFLSDELVSRGHTSLLAFPKVMPDWLKQRFHQVGANIIELKLGNSLPTGLRLMRTIKQYRVDIIHCTFIPIFSPLTFFLGLSRARELIFSDQLSRFLETPRAYRKTICHTKSWILCPLIDLIIADAEYIRQSLITDCYVNPSKIVRLYNGVNLDRFKPGEDGGTIRDELNISAETSVITTIAWAIPHKGLDVYLRAAKEVIKYFPKTVFLVVGDGPLLHWLRKSAMETGISKNVIFTGLRTDIHKLLAATDIAVLLSRWGEAFSFSMLEAMASGKPLIASEIGAIPEGVDDGKTGILVPPGDHAAVAQAIIKLLGDKRLLVDMGNAAREKCEKYYDIRTMVKQTVDIYEALV